MLRSFPKWAVVATAESMQIPYECKPCPNCQCGTGKAQPGPGAAGCGACFTLRTTGKNPYGGSNLPIVEFNATVADSCPYAANQQWCPEKVGGKNQYGFEYHFDVFEDDWSKLGIGDNPIVTFVPIECPSDVVQVMQKACCGIWYQGQGCLSICGSNYHCPN